jgi:pimeloyl-ACP methyl ester carboxylesterase
VAATRDVILVDQRGVGYSQPAMSCPPKNLPGVSAQASAPTLADSSAQERQWAQSCHDLLIGQGFDLTMYNTAASASDLRDLRQALGYTQWNLFGISYGTRLALTMMRSYPEGIRSVTLDSVLPPQVIRIGQGDLSATVGSFAALFAACKADPACDQDYPNLEPKLYELIERLDQRPAQLVLPDGDTGATKRVWITGATVIVAIQEMMKLPYLIQIVPITITQLHAGAYSSLERLASHLAPELNWANFNLVMCHDASAAFNAEQFYAELKTHPALRSYFASSAGDGQAPMCGLWAAGRAELAESQPVVSAIPTLLLSGGAYDPATPPAYARLAASTLSHPFVYEFPAYSHAVTGNVCPQTMLADFLNEPSRAPNAGCLAQASGLPFVTDVYYNAGASDLFLIVQQYPDASRSIMIGIIGVMLLAWMLFVPISAMRARAQAAPRQPLAAAGRWMLWLAALLNSAFGLGVWLLAKQALAMNYGWVTLFGFAPTSSRYLFILPWLAALLTLGSLACTLLAWKQRGWWRFERIIYSLGALAALSFTALLISWNALAV